MIVLLDLVDDKYSEDFDTFELEFLKDQAKYLSEVEMLHRKIGIERLDLIPSSVSLMQAEIFRYKKEIKQE